MPTPPPVSIDTFRLWNFLPQFVQDGDEAGGYQFLQWLDGIGSQQQIIDNLCRDDPINPGWSIVLDVNRCPTYALPWLAQFVGVRFSSSQTTDAQQRAAIIAEQGFNRGTVGAIVAAANAYLTGSYTATVIERTPDPYSLTIRVPNAGIVVPATQAIISAAVLAAIPAGLVATVTFI